MAAAGCAGSVSRLGQRAKARPGAVSNPRHVRVLTLEEARCPVCLEILLEPVTMPCRHSVCLQCFKRTVECSGLCCPSCRLRVSSWARNKQCREKSLVNTELWEMVRQSYPESCGRRLAQRERVMASADVFCSPKQICKPGETRHECDEQKNKMMMVMDEESEEKMKKLPGRKKGKCGLQHSQDTSLGVLSDSENEEPMRMRTRHASAFVRRSRISPAICRRLYNINVQRSQSCTDSEEGRKKVRAQSHLSSPEKASICHSFNAGILLSSENSRSFSAPVLPLDKRQHWRLILASPPSSLVPYTKPERSVSPESNDSISEELNHFKPIVCSPCTPPKRLPDGRLMEPTIVKSTPRNLMHSLQKSTSYEASPSILQKWKQVEIDRQRVKFMSKGTITSPVDYSITQSSAEDQENKSCNCGPMEKGLPGQQCTCAANANLSRKQREKSLQFNNQQSSFDQCSKDDGLQSTNAHPSLMALCNSDTEKQCGDCEPRCSPSGRVEISKSTIVDKHTGVSHNQGIEEFQDLRNEPTVRSCVLNRPTSRRGKKRSQKTKHLEETKRIKISKTESCESCEPQYQPNDLYVQRIRQERMDRELALKLQKQFDKEGQKVERHRTSSDKYPLRPWICVDGRAARNPRRSGRISRKIKHFN